MSAQETRMRWLSSVIIPLLCAAADFIKICKREGFSHLHDLSSRTARRGGSGVRKKRRVGWMDVEHSDLLADLLNGGPGTYRLNVPASY